MSTNPESDFERQFREDLEKATALSLETLALDQFRRNKIQYSHSDVGQTNNSIYKSTSHNILSTNKNATRPRPGSFNAASSLQNSASTGSIAPPPAVPPRRHSESREILPSHTKDEPDLISFAGAASEPAQYNGGGAAEQLDSHASFVQMVGEMHKLNAQLQEIPKPIAQHPFPTTNLSYGFQSAAAVAPPSMMPYNSTAAGLQLVPYALPPQQQQNNQIPLTPEQLTKLYNMNYAMQPYPNALQRPPQTSQIFHPQMQPNFAPSATTIYPNLQRLHNPNNIATTPENRNFGHTNLASSGFTSTPIQQPPPFSAPILQNNQTVTLPQLPPRQPARDLTPILAASSSNLSQIASTSSTSNSTNIVRRNKKLGDDLIDLNNGTEDNSRVSVLEAFDPLLMGNDDDDDDDDKGENASDCATSYYSEYDPFDYLYSGGTQYSDPVYEAVNRIDRTPSSPSGAPPPPGWAFNPIIGWNVSASDAPFSPNTTTTTLSPPPPLPPRNFKKINDDSQTYAIDSATDERIYYPALDRRKISTKLYENVVISKTYDHELVAFYDMVKRVRAQYKYNDLETNVGHVVAAEFDNVYPEGQSIKLLVHPAIECIDQSNRTSTGSMDRHSLTNIRDSSSSSSSFSQQGSHSEPLSSMNNGKGQIEGYGPPVVFTCDICTTVEHVIMHVFCELEGQILGSVNDFMLKPIGVTEWLSPRSKLSQLECVHNSLKLEQDVQLGLCPRTHANMNAIGRTLQDDIRDAELKMEDILANESVDTIDYDNLMILLETLEDEVAKLEMSASDGNAYTVLSCSGVVQAVKMICALLGSLDTLEITSAVDELKKVCANGQTVYGNFDSNYSGATLNIVSESGDYAEVSLRPKTINEQISHRCNRIRDSVQILLETYSHAFRVNFSVTTADYTSNPIQISNVTQPVVAHVLCLHRPPPNWRFDDYMLGAQIYHGTRYIGDAVVTQCSNEISGIFPRLKFDSWLNFENIPICTLPRESRLIFVLYGCRQEPTEGGADANNESTGQDARKITKIELGWSALQFFDYNRKMVQGSFLLSLWPPTTDKFLGPAPAKGTHPNAYYCPVLSIEVPNYGGQIIFPEPPKNQPAARQLDFNSLDLNLQQELIDTAEQGYPSALDKREVLWEKRHYLQALPHALPKILHAAHSWDFASLVDLHALIRSWHPLSPLQSLELFLPRYPDIEVRAQAVRWVSTMPNDQLCDFLPQLLQALKHDTYEASPMAAFLLRRSLESPRIAHQLYWLLVHSLPGDSPQNSNEPGSDIDETQITQARYNRRNQMMLRALLAICGEKLSGRFLIQNLMCKNLADIALNVKLSKESLRQKTLVQGMEVVNQILLDRPTSLPLGLGLEVVAVNARNSSYFNSNTLPLKINFLGSDRMNLPAIFKAGDDLQQDMLTIQLVRIMDKLWLKEGLDLKMVTFNCVPTGHKKGMIEMISDAETLRKIQVEWGLTGSFKDKPIAEWLARQNPSQLEYQRAVDNFTVSCAGYSVVTYILGICDRHNDNIMLKTSGHLFHIDFGKFLGDAQMFGNFKRDRTPFVLTSDMAYVINGGDRPSTKFHHFVDLCCKAFNIVRKHGDLILHMLALMATSGIPGVTADAVNYVRNALLPGQSNPEAAASFAKMIHISLKSWFTQFNFFLHNLAQLRFSGDDGNGELLNFVPRTYTMAQDGRLQSVSVHGYQKRYDLEKYYTFILKVTRQNQPDPAYLFRSYKEFLEFHQKLCLHYPLAKLHSLPSGIHVGRSNIKTVAERRLPEIRLFLKSLFLSADEIAHSDLVYTFFHPLLRDQQEQDIHVAKVKETRQVNPTERVCGEIKLSLQYHRGALVVMIHHARSLPCTTSGQEPNTYVKVYLKPDPTKVTKRKTQVVRKNCFPSFMETLEYRMSLEYIQNRILQVTVWSHDTLQENEFLGGVELHLAQLDLREELVKWFPLGYLSRS